MTGLLSLTVLNIHRPLTITGTPTKYTNPDGPMNFSRYFCGECGSSVYEYGDSERPDAAEYASLATGALEGIEPGVAQIKGHIFVSDTGDGGMSVWMPQLPRFQQEDKGPVYEGPFTSKSAAAGAPPRGSEDKLECSCKCGGVRFYVTRPNKASYELHAPKIVPHSRGANVADEKWWIAADGGRYTANLCACDSCRRFAGFDIVQWAFVPKINIFQMDGKPIDFAAGTLRSYNSSEGVRRYFCSGCGATVFFRSEEKPDLIDIGVGLMHAASGSRAEEWLDWKLEGIDFVEDAKNKELIGLLESGLKEYERKVTKT